MKLALVCATFLASAIWTAACASPTYEVPVTIDNVNNVAAELFVGDERAPEGPALGYATPPVVAAHDAIHVTLTVPAHKRWAFFIRGADPINLPAFTSEQLHGCRGPLPVEIQVTPLGRSVKVPDNDC